MVYISRTIYTYTVNFFNVIVTDNGNEVEEETGYIYSTCKLNKDELARRAAKQANGRIINLNPDPKIEARRMSLDEFVEHSLVYDRPASQRKE